MNTTVPWKNLAPSKLIVVLSGLACYLGRGQGTRDGLHVGAAEFSKTAAFLALISSCTCCLAQNRVPIVQLT